MHTTSGFEVLLLIYIAQPICNGKNQRVTTSDVALTDTGSVAEIRALSALMNILLGFPVPMLMTIYMHRRLDFSLTTRMIFCSLCLNHQTSGYPISVWREWVNKTSVSSSICSTLLPFCQLAVGMQFAMDVQ